MRRLTDPWATPDALRGRTVLLAMSGGVDSSAAAVVLLERGARVLGLTMKNFCYSEVEGSDRASCCSLQHMLDARRVCEALGIPHYLLDVTREFNHEVLEPFVVEYGSGRTPNPCVDCNMSVRFPVLLEQARQLGAELLATGHYARVVTDADGRYYVARGVDTAKDQSYFLHGVPRPCLEHTVFPLGGMRKEESRRLAEEAGLPVADKPESQEICFLPNGGRGSFLARYREPRPGPIRDTAGRVLGRHAGIGNFTVGQRRGLNVAVGHPVYVTHIDAATNTVVVGEEDALWSGGVQLDRFWQRGAPAVESLAVQLRYRSRPAAVRHLETSGETATIQFIEPQRAVAPGQAAVLYDGDTVVGGGRIQRALDGSPRTSPSTST